MQISVQHDLDRLMRKFSALGATQINRSLNQALNRTATMARTEAVREIRKTYDFKARTVRGTFRITRARGNQAEAVLTSAGRRIRLIDMSAKPGKTGASVRVTKQRKTIKSTFIARMPTGHVGVFEREGKKRLMQLNQASRYVIGFSNPISTATVGRLSSFAYGQGGAITSGAFTYQGFANCFLEDNNGIIRVFRRVEQNIFGVAQNVGTINYETGQIILNDFNPTAIAAGGVTLKIFAKPSGNDILPLRGQIVSIRDNDITVNLTNDKSISLVRR